MIRVFLVHNDVNARERLRKLLSAAADVTLTGVTTYAEQRPAALPSECADVVVMGLLWPLGIQAQQSPTESRDVPLIVFTSTCECADSGRLRPGWPAACLCASAAATHLLAAVRAVHAGEPYSCPQLTADHTPMRPGIVNVDPRLKRLTPRQFELFRQLAAGRPNREIAAALGLSPKTVSAHRMHILGKLGLRTNIDLARLAFTTGLLNE
jgi:DNA-binding NarL/FixJ family response regulator